MMKKIVFVFLMLMAFLVVAGCGGTQVDSAVEEELASLADEELESMVAAGQSSATAGQAVASSRTIAGKTLTAKQSAAAAKAVLEKKRQGLIVTPMSRLQAAYQKMNYSSEQMWKDLLYSNTLLYDSKKDYFLFYYLTQANDPKIPAAEKAQAKSKVTSLVNSVYSQMDASGMEKTAWLIAAEKNLKPMMFKNKYQEMQSLVSPDALQAMLDKQGAGGFLDGCADQGKNADVAGNDKKQQKPNSRAGESVKDQASNPCGATGGGSGGAYGGGTGGMPSTGSLSSIIGCIDSYKQSQAGSASMGGQGGKGGSTGGGAGNPGSVGSTGSGEGTGGGFGEGVGGNTADPTGMDGNGGNLAGGKSNHQGCFGVDQSKLQDYAGKNQDTPATKQAKQTLKDTNVMSKGFAVAQKGSGGMFSITKGTPTSTGVMLSTKVFDSTNGQQIGDTKISSAKGSAGDVLNGIKEEGNVIDTKTGSNFQEAPETTAKSGSQFNPDSDASNPCGADVAGFAACIGGTMSKTPGETYDDVVKECKSADASNCMGPGKTDTCAKGAASTLPGSAGGGACGAVSGCLMGEGIGGKDKSPGKGKGNVKDIDPAASKCHTAANEAIGLLMQTLITDPVDMNMKFSATMMGNMLFDSAMFSAKSANVAKSAVQSATSNTGAAKAATGGAGECIGNSCN